MLKNKENNHNSKFRIKLLADNNVIMLEADNYETEIFTPHIINGRLTFLNIIPNRRCCQISSGSRTNAMKFVPTKATKEFKNGAPLKLGRYSATQDAIAMPAPLANSTPANIKHRSNGGQQSNKSLYNSNAFKTSCESTQPTPQPIRRAVALRPQMLEKSMLNLTKDVKLAPIYPNAKEGTPKKMARLVATSPNVSLLNGSFSLQNSPVISSNSRQNKNLVGVDSLARWRKVLTPVRTYTRTSKQPVMLQRPKIVASAKKSQKPLKVRPSYLVNPTKGPNVTLCIEMRKRKVIIDTKLRISPKTFKRQQQEPLDKCQVISKSLLLPRKHRNCQDTLAMSAFDLLTNSNRKHCISYKLNEQFRLGCVNKASSTYTKYKVLCSIPALQQDEQVLEISRMSMPAD